MFDDILFPTDGSDGAEAAVDHAFALAERFDATIHVLFVADTNRDSLTRVRGQVVDVLETEGEGIVEATAEAGRERGVDCTTAVLQGDPARTIADYAETRGIDLVVMPTHGRTGLHRYLLGSVTERVVRASPVPVLVVRMGDDERSRFPYRRVLAATDGSEAGETAGERAVDLAAALDARLHVLGAVEDRPLGIDVRSDAVRQDVEETVSDGVERIEALATERSVADVTSAVVSGTPYRVLLDRLDADDVDLVVLGRTGGDDASGGLGGVTEKLVRSSPVPVLVVPSGGPRNE